MIDVPGELLQYDFGDHFQAVYDTILKTFLTKSRKNLFSLEYTMKPWYSFQRILELTNDSKNHQHENTNLVPGDDQRSANPYLKYCFYMLKSSPESLLRILTYQEKSLLVENAEIDKTLRIWGFLKSNVELKSNNDSWPF